MTTYIHEHLELDRNRLSRRLFLRTMAAGGAAVGLQDWMSLHADELRKQGRSVILLYMQGGPSQFETFDPKPGTENGGPTKAIDTNVPGIQIAEGWEKMAKVMDKSCIIRSMTNKEGNHQRATYQLHTGYVPSGSVKHPHLGSSIAKELSNPEETLPAFVSMGPTVGAAFLGVDYEPFVIGNPGSPPQNVIAGVPTPRFNRRTGLLSKLEGEFETRGGEQVVQNHRRIYDKASKLMLSPELKAFDLSSEPQSLRDSYGETNFGRGCLLARRLVESGVTFVEVSLGNWDTHDDNFNRVKTLAGQADPAMSTLINDLSDRGLLEKTLVVWYGEFGRTPRVNPRTGRDHYPRVFNALVAGGGLKAGHVIGASNKEGSAVEKDPVTVPDLHSTICQAMKVDPTTENMSPIGRPLKIVDGGTPISSLL